MDFRFQAARLLSFQLRIQGPRNEQVVAGRTRFLGDYAWHAYWVVLGAVLLVGRHFVVIDGGQGDKKNVHKEIHLQRTWELCGWLRKWTKLSRRNSRSGEKVLVRWTNMGVLGFIYDFTRKKPGKRRQTEFLIVNPIWANWSTRVQLNLWKY